MKPIPLTQAKARLSELVERLIQMKGYLVITKHGKPAVALVSYEEWERQRTGMAGGLAAVSGPRKDLDKEIDGMIEEIYEARAKSRGRKVRL